MGPQICNIYKVWKNGGKKKEVVGGRYFSGEVVNNTTLKREILWRQNSFLVGRWRCNFLHFVAEKKERNFQLKEVQ